MIYPTKPSDKVSDMMQRIPKGKQLRPVDVMKRTQANLQAFVEVRPYEPWRDEDAFRDPPHPYIKP